MYFLVEGQSYYFHIMIITYITVLFDTKSTYLHDIFLIVDVDGHGNLHLLKAWCGN